MFFIIFSLLYLIIVVLTYNFHFKFKVTMEYADPQNVEGEMTVGAKQKSNLGEPDFNTLDEPIKDTIVSLCYVICIAYNIKLMVLLFSITAQGCLCSR